MIHVIPQPTPNPNAMKFNISRTVIDSGSRTFDTREAAAAHPVARRLFEIEGIVSVFMLKDFITINKRPDADWDQITPAAAQAIQAGLAPAA